MSSPEDIAELKAEIKRLRKTLAELTPDLQSLLRRRGFKIYKKEPAEDLLLPKKRFIDEYYETLKRYSFRLFLRDVIKHQESFQKEDVQRYATAEVTEDYINYLLKIGLAEHAGAGLFRLVKRPIKSFGETLEWFCAEIFRREFQTEAIWGVKFKRPLVGGDYDLISKVNGSILYMEIKSSPPKQIYQNEIAAFLNRVEDLMPEISIFFMDTELRMKDKIVPMFEQELSLRGSGAAVERMVKELFHIGNNMFIINSKDSVVANIEKVLSWHFRGGR